MVRISKQEERRSKCPKRCRPPAKKTGPLKDKLPQGYKPHLNALTDHCQHSLFIPKIKG